jgi:crotonobetainyl-CoA:carnitine CoA-transferase CaiB-like acyl-CoA transferase
MLPLSGLRVLDVSQVMAGPFCCMMLGDMGADVIKVEPPGGGDSTRRAMGIRLKGDDSPGFLALNRNKRSIVLDLKSLADREIFYALVKSADVLVENGRPGVAKRLGMDYPVLREINPGLVYASISGFGQTGPWAQRSGYDLIAQAMAGALSATGHPNSDPVKNGIPLGDLGASMFAVYGILSAIIGRNQSGEGRYVDASLFEAVLGLSVWESMEYWATGCSPKPLGTANRMSAPYQAVRAKDGYFVFGAANQKLWRTFLSVIGRPELGEDERFATNADRVNNAAILIEELRPLLADRTADAWVTVLLDAGIPAGPINDYRQALENEHVAAREMVQDIAHPVEGSYKTLGFPVKLSGHAQEVRYPPPLLGQHTDEVVSELVERGLLAADRVKGPSNE